MHIFRTRHSDSKIAPNAHSDHQGQGSRAKRAIATALTLLGTVSLLGLAACPADLEDPERFNIVVGGGGDTSGGAGTGGGATDTPAPACVVAAFARTCTQSGCHKGTVGAAAGLSLEGTGLNGRLVDVDAPHTDAEPATGCVPGKFIDTANRSASWLLLKIKTPAADQKCGIAMPVIGTLTADELTCVESYVMTATK